MNEWKTFISFASINTWSIISSFVDMARIDCSWAANQEPGHYEIDENTRSSNLRCDFNRNGLHSIQTCLKKFIRIEIRFGKQSSYFIMQLQFDLWVTRSINIAVVWWNWEHRWPAVSVGNDVESSTWFSTIWMKYKAKSKCDCWTLQLLTLSGSIIVNSLRECGKKYLERYCK